MWIEIREENKTKLINLNFAEVISVKFVQEKDCVCIKFLLQFRINDKKFEELYVEKYSTFDEAKTRYEVVKQLLVAKREAVDVDDLLSESEKKFRKRAENNEV